MTVLSRGLRQGIGAAQTPPPLLHSVLLVSILTLGLHAQATKTPVPAGVWGGKGIQMTVTAAGATIAYDCDAGRIDERLQTDASGKFIARGTHAFGRGGPRFDGEPRPKPRAARYEGVVISDKMELTISLPDLGRKVGVFTLQFGKRAVLDRCG